MTPTPAVLVSRLARAYPRMTVPQETFAVYLEDLAQVPPALLEAAVEKLVRTEEFFPTLRAIRAACAELALELPSGTEALQLVDAYLDEMRLDREIRWTMPQIVADAVKLSGGYREFRTSQDPHVVRGQFARYYGELRAAAILEAQVHPSIRGGVRDGYMLAA